MVIDEATVVAGSCNYTEPANAFNDENIFVMGSPHPDLPALRAARSTRRRARSSPALPGEIERIVASGERFVPV